MSASGSNGAGARRSGLYAAEVIWMYIAAAIVAGTGIVYGWFRYFATPEDPYAVVASPWQPFVQHLHVLAAPALVFGAGMLWRSHVLASWRTEGAGRRTSGLSLALSTVPMIVTGYLAQVAVEEFWRRTWGIVHAVFSVTWIAGSAIHLLSRRRPSPRPPPPEAASP